MREGEGKEEGARQAPYLTGSSSILLQLRRYEIETFTTAVLDTALYEVSRGCHGFAFTFGFLESDTHTRHDCESAQSLQCAWRERYDGFCGCDVL